MDLPGSSPQMGYGGHRPAAHCREISADTGLKTCGTWRCLEMFCSSLKEKNKQTVMGIFLSSGSLGPIKMKEKVNAAKNTHLTSQRKQCKGQSFRVKKAMKLDLFWWSLPVWSHGWPPAWTGSILGSSPAGLEPHLPPSRSKHGAHWGCPCVRNALLNNKEEF